MLKNKTCILQVDSTRDDLIDMDSTIIDARDCPGITDAGKELIDNVSHKIGDIVTTVVKIRKVNLPDISEYIQNIEYYRWDNFKIFFTLPEI